MLNSDAVFYVFVIIIDNNFRNLLPDMSITIAYAVF